MHLVLALLGALRAGLGARTDLVLENLALRQQLALLRRRSKRPRFGPLDRLFWIWLSQRWARWRETLNVVRPETVIGLPVRPRRDFQFQDRSRPHAAASTSVLVDTFRLWTHDDHNAPTDAALTKSRAAQLLRAKDSIPAETS